MKNGLRFVFAAVLVACIAALGFSQGAVAKIPSSPVATATPTLTPTAVPGVPSCPSSVSETHSGSMAVCSASVDVKANLPAGGVASLSRVDLSQLPPLPGQGGYGVGVNVSILDKNGSPVNAFVEVCFSDAGGFGYVYRWVTAAEFKAWYNVSQNGGWVLFPTYHKAGGLTCTKSWVTGTFALHH